MFVDLEKTCKFSKDQDHSEVCDHIELPDCDCRDKLDDPVHREKFHHVGYPDILIICRHGAKCNEKKVPTHYRGFKHL